MFVPITLLLGITKFNAIEFIKNFVAFSMSYCGEWWYIKSYLLAVTIFVCFIALCRYIRSCIPMLMELFLIILFGEIIVHIIPIARDFMGEADGLVGIANKIITGFVFAGLDLMPGLLFGAFFAKYDLLSKIKKYFYENKKLRFVIGVLLLICVLLLRLYDSGKHDYLLSCLFIIGCIPICLAKCFVINILKKIGYVSMSIWLCHTFICYKLIPNITYSSRTPIVIFIQTMIISYFVSKLIDFLYDKIVFIIKRRI